MSPKNVGTLKHLVGMLLGTQKMQQPTIDESGKCDGRPVQEQQGSGRKKTGLRRRWPATKVSTIAQWRGPTNVDGQQ
jgi:hypothetical protein